MIEPRAQHQYAEGEPVFADERGVRARGERGVASRGRPRSLEEGGVSVWCSSAGWLASAPLFELLGPPGAACEIIDVVLFLEEGSWPPGDPPRGPYTSWRALA